MDAFDSNALIYAAIDRSRAGRRVAAELTRPDAAAVGSVMLLPEVLTKPIAVGNAAATARLEWLLGHLELLPVTAGVAQIAVDLGARYGLRTVDAIHLATAVAAGADRFITNNRSDFRADAIVEIAIVSPDQLPGRED